MVNKMLKKYAKNERGLTLIELLVVIVILGIIAAIAVVSIGGIIGNTRDKATVTEASQIINAAKLAHSSEPVPGDGSWDEDDLTEFLSSVDTTGWSVELNDDGDYEISGHAATGIITANATTATEAEISEFLGGSED
jgi:type IV pilus assembly protein PilA